MSGAVAEILGMMREPPSDRLVVDRASDGAVAVLDPSTPGGRRGALSGSTWAGFVVGDLVGEGGMGEVYRAVQASVGRFVALKVLSAGTHDDPEHRLRLMAEARAAARIRSPHVVAVFDAGEHQGRPWLAMEFITGCTLAEEIARRSQAGMGFTPLEAAGLAQQAARGLAVVHAEGLVHRDVKPANLMLGGDGRLRVADFGLVRFLGERALTATGMVIGTPLYLSPEQGRGLPAAATADVYGLGVVLYELLTLRPPFAGANADELVRMHNFVEPVLPAQLNPDVPQDLQGVVIRCLHKDPARRYPDAQALADDLDRLCRGMAPRTAVFAPGELSTGADEALSRLAGPRHRFLAAGLLALTVLGLGAGWWWLDARKDEARLLRGRLAPMAQSVAIPATAAGDLERLARLAGGDDPQVVQGRAKLVRVGSLVATLERVAAEEALGQVALAEARSALAGLSELVGEAGDPRLGRWSAQIAEAAAGVERLRARLAPLLSRSNDPTSVERAAIAADLTLFLRVVPEGDRDRQAWRARLAQVDARNAEQRRRLARLDDPAPLSARDISVMKQACLAYAQAVPDDAAVPAWLERIANEEEAVRLRSARLGQLLDQPLLSPGERQELTDLRSWLVARGGLDKAREQRVSDRLAASAAELAALRGRLAALDAPRTLPQGISEALDRFEALAGFADADGIRWRRRFEAVRALQARLAPLDRPEPVPPAADDDLRHLIELVGATDPQAAAWSAKVETVRSGKLRLAAGLDPARPVPPDAAAGLARLAAAIGGEDEDVRRWSAKLTAVGRMAADEPAWDGLAVLDEVALNVARAALAERRALVGDDAVVRRREVRIAELLGPTPPAWAAEHGRDGHGPWITVHLGEVAQRLRWLPPIRFTMGSPVDEAGHEVDEVPVRIRLTRGCWIADSECTQALYRVVTGQSPARAPGDEHPVEQVSRADAEAFCTRLGALAGCTVRLPDEAEWEAATRAGQAGVWAWLDAEHAAVAIVHAGNGGSHQAVGSGSPNPLGLRHTLGNVWEWCRGGYGPLPVGAEIVDPAAATGAMGVVRGGAYNEALTACRPANRVAVDPRTRSPCIGFRFVVEDGR